jgi:hypothetical protein
MYTALAINTALLQSTNVTTARARARAKAARVVIMDRRAGAMVIMGGRAANENLQSP